MVGRTGLGAPGAALQGLTASLTYYDVDYTDRIDVVLNTALTNAVRLRTVCDPPPAGERCHRHGRVQRAGRSRS